MKTIFSYKGTILFAAIAGITLIFVPLLQANAQDVDWTHEIKKGKSYVIYCHAGFAIATSHVKLQPGESKTVGCETDKQADIHLKWGVIHGENSEKVFWCDHDNPLRS